MRVKIFFQRRWQDATTAELLDWEAKPTEVPGLVFTRPVALDANDNPIEDKSGWNITHEQTGLRVGPRFRTLGEAKLFIAKLEVVGVYELDWTKDPRKDWEPYRKALVATKELIGEYCR